MVHGMHSAIYILQNEKVPRFPFVVSLSNHDGNQPFDKLRANGFRSKIQFCWLYLFIKFKWLNLFFKKLSYKF
ncbi:hypothetical protein B0182_03270 [Moraxella bovis]|nr:hypothetical protein DQF64_09970 [Moraxella bovis]OOR91243.1 hypothetical protein B0182_03270 [Moraxella bovis]